MKTIQTVKEYNAQQKGAGMMFLNNDGSQRKRGFVVIIKGRAKLCKTLNDAENINGLDLEPKETLACYSHGGHNTIEAEMNN
jgi:hypothetical protein